MSIVRFTVKLGVEYALFSGITPKKMYIIHYSGDYQLIFPFIDNYLQYWKYTSFKFYSFPFDPVEQNKLFDQLDNESYTISFLGETHSILILEFLYKKYGLDSKFEMMTFTFLSLNSLSSDDLRIYVKKNVLSLLFYHKTLIIPDFVEENNDFLAIDRTKEFDYKDEFIYSMLRLILKHGLELNDYSRIVLKYLYNLSIRTPNGIKHFYPNNMLKGEIYIAQFNERNEFVIKHRSSTKEYEIGEFSSIPAKKLCNFLLNNEGLVETNKIYIIFGHDLKSEEEKYYIFLGMSLVQEMNDKVSKLPTK